METKTKVKKKFDAVKFQREVRAKISREIMDMTPEQILEYFNKKNLKERILPST